ncbi:MAG: hypothetical protein Q9227_002529 [Pyrenula ochraceoflavens]
MSSPRDPLAVQYFERIFAPGGRPGEDAYEKRVKATVSELGHPTLEPGISGIEPTTQRQQANYRYYCDNDPQDIQGTSRWKLKKDPPLSDRPPSYIPMRKRVSKQDARPGQPTREWEDRDNGVQMDGTGCHGEKAAAVTYRTLLPGYDRLPSVRATVTVCYQILKSRKLTDRSTKLCPPFFTRELKFTSVNEMMDKPVDLNLLRAVKNSRFYVDVLAVNLKSYVISHSMNQLPPWTRGDLVIGDELALGWRTVNSLPARQRLLAVDTYVFYALV